jgi:uncharacterized protein (TIGR02217 family)
MSNAVFPTLAGLTWDVRKSPEFNNVVRRSASLYRTAISLADYPIWHYALQYEFLRDNATNDELNQLIGFFLARKGNYDSWLFDDPDGNSVTAQNIGTGNGTTTQFQLTRTVGGFAEPVQNPKASPAPQIYKGGVLQTVTTHYTIDAYGVVTFVTAPTAGQAITWTGGYYIRCEFKETMQEYTKFLHKLWSARRVDFRSVKL